MADWTPPAKDTPWTPPSGDAPWSPPAGDAAAAPEPSFMENVGTGLMDRLYGALQLAARMPEYGESSRSFTYPASEMPSADRGEGIKYVDAKVKAREQQIQKEGGGGWGRVAGNVLGDIGLTAPLMAVGGPAAGMARVGQAALQGAAGGAVSGALTPATAQNFGGEKAGQIALGGAVGGVVGGALGGIESAVRSFMTPATDKVAKQATDAVVRRITQDAKAGGPTADDALRQVAEWQKAGKPMTLTDVGGENTLALGGHVGRAPGESRAVARSFLDQRDRGASERLNQDVSGFVSGGPSAFQTTQALLSARSQAARPLYQQAESLQGIWSPRLQQFIEEPDVKRGLARGLRLERLDALAENRPFSPTAMGIDLDAEGNVLIKKVPNLRVLDMGKRGLDAMIADERDAITGRLSALGRSLDGVKRSYVSEIDGLDTSGVYRSAREAWGGPSTSLDSVRFGRTIFNRSPEETADHLAGLGANDQEFARLGVADVLRERIAKTGFGGNEARAVIKNPWTREQLRPLFQSEQQFDRFVDAVTAEHRMAEVTTKVMRGSQTAERAAEDAAGTMRSMASAGGLMHSLVTLHPVTALRHAAQLYRDLGIGNNEKLNEAVAKLLFGTHPKFFEAQPASRPASSYAAPAAGSAGADAAVSAFGLR